MQESKLGPRDELSIFIDKLQMPVAEKIEDYPTLFAVDWRGVGACFPTVFQNESLGD
jgi:hypothetical protein